jgi:hypothetical protein
VPIVTDLKRMLAALFRDIQEQTLIPGNREASSPHGLRSTMSAGSGKSSQLGLNETR